MTCRQARKAIANWAVGLTDSGLAARARAHARRCRACGELMARELALTGILRGPVTAERAPSGLSARIDSAIRAAVGPPRPALRWLPGAVACASVVFVAAGGLWLGTLAGGLQPPTGTVAMSPAESVPAGVETPSAVAREPSLPVAGAARVSTDEPALAPAVEVHAAARLATAYESLRAPRRSTPTTTNWPAGPEARTPHAELRPGTETPGPVELSLAMDVPADELSMDLGVRAEPIARVPDEGSSDVVLAGMTSLIMAPAVSSSSVVPAPPAGPEVHSR